MKITIDPNMPHLSKEDVEEMDQTVKDVEEDPQAFKEAMLNVKEAVFSPQVIDQLKEMGMTPDEVIAMMLKKAGASQ